MSDSLGEVARSRLRALYSRRRFVQFASVGFVGAAIDSLALAALVELAALDPLVAKVLAWELAIATIFVVNERWTFASHGETGVGAFGRRFLRSHLVRLGGFLVTLSVLAILVYGADVWYLAANVVGIGAGFVVNYTCESLFTWQVHRRDR